MLPLPYRQQYLDICTWSDCGTGCSTVPGKPNELTTDSGGPSSRCRSVDHGVDDPPSRPWYQTRSLCCPSPTSFSHCDWHSKKSCSEACPSGQLEIDSDPNGPGGHLGGCYGSRRQVFCCDPPGGLSRPFLPVDLDKIFPQPDLPAASSIPQFDLVSFGGLAGGGEADPNADGVAFFLIAGDSYAVNNLKKRSGEPEPFTFLDCPEDALGQPDDKYQTARVVCLSSDVEGCFQVRERGVEGTIVEMPDNCARGSWARAISLEISHDQSLPRHTMKRAQTSQVYDFVFDYNMALRRRDAGPSALRMDYSNLGGYWNAVVDSDGIQNQKRSLEERFFSAKSSDWTAKYAALDFPSGYAKSVNQKLDSLVYFATVDTCPVSSADYLPEGFGAGLRGNYIGELYYGFSMIANIEAEKLIVREAAGFFRAEGTTDITFDIGGLGTMDISKTNMGNPALKLNSRSSLGGHSIFKGWATFDPYIQTEVGIASENLDPSDSTAVSFDGVASIRVQTDLGQNTLYYPDIAQPFSGSRPQDQLSVSGDNIMYHTSGNGLISVQSYINLGLKVDLALPSRIGTGDGDLPDMSVRHSNIINFNVTQSDTTGDGCLDFETESYVYQNLDKGPSVGWTNGGAQIASQAHHPDAGKCFKDQNPFSKRSLNPRQLPGWPGFPNLTPGHQVGCIDIGLSAYAAYKALIIPRDSFTCLEEEEDDDPCCGCICMQTAYGYSDIVCPDCDGDDPSSDPAWPGPGASSRKRAALPVSVQREEFNSELELETDEYQDGEGEVHELDKRRTGVATLGYKKVTVLGQKLNGPQYPSFPKPASFPWDGIQNGRWDAIGRYYGNESADCENW